MTRILRQAAFLVLMVGIGIDLDATAAQTHQALPIKGVMAKLNKGPDALVPTLGKSLRVDAPNWEAIEAETKTLLNLAEMLTRNNPPRGNRTSWNELVRAYLQGIQALQEAVQKQDKEAAIQTHARIANSTVCNNCHKAHRG